MIARSILGFFVHLIIHLSVVVIVTSIGFRYARSFNADLAINIIGFPTLLMSFAINSYFLDTLVLPWILYLIFNILVSKFCDISTTSMPASMAAARVVPTPASMGTGIVQGD
jgi:hypothetical protein